MSKAYKTLAAMNGDMLIKKKGELEKELVKLRGQAATGASQKNPYALRNSRRAIARIVTLVQQKGQKQKTNKGDEQA